MTEITPLNGHAAVATPPAARPRIETLLFDNGLISPDQLGELVREAVQTGQPADAIAIARGWVSSAQLEALLGPSEQPAAPVQPAALVSDGPVALVPEAPAALVPELPAAVVPEPAPVPAVEAAPAVVDLVPEPAHAEPEPEPAALVVEHVPEAVPAPVEPEQPAAQTAAASFAVRVLLADGGSFELGDFADAGAARAWAEQATRELATGDTGAWPLFGNRFVRPSSVSGIELVARPL